MAFMRERDDEEAAEAKKEGGMRCVCGAEELVPAAPSAAELPASRPSSSSATRCSPIARRMKRQQRATLTGFRTERRKGA